MEAALFCCSGEETLIFANLPRLNALGYVQGK